MGLLTKNIGTANFYRAFREEPEAAPDVVLIQGFGLSPRGMGAPARFLRGMGLKTTTARLGGLFGTYQTGTVRAAGERLGALLCGLPNRPWLIGHSHGGMIARWAVQQTAAASHVRGVITLATPHRGTPAAVIGLAFTPISRAPFDLLPMSPLVRKLNGAPWPEGMPLVSIVSTRDPLCIHPFGRVPFEGERVRTIVFEGLGHTELLADPEVLGAIASILSP